MKNPISRHLSSFFHPAAIMKAIGMNKEKKIFTEGAAYRKQQPDFV